MTTSVDIKLTSDNGSNESLIFETLKKSGAVKCLSFHSSIYGHRGVVISPQHAPCRQRLAGFFVPR
jgi:hypothetical protein